MLMALTSHGFEGILSTPPLRACCPERILFPHGSKGTLFHRSSDGTLIPHGPEDPVLSRP